VVLSSARLLPEEGTLASEQRLAAVRLEFVELENDLLKGKRQGTSPGESGGFAQRADAPAGCTRFLRGTFRRVHWGVSTCPVSWIRIRYWRTRRSRFGTGTTKRCPCVRRVLSAKIGPWATVDETRYRRSNRGLRGLDKWSEFLARLISH
jgi:hypothetical protein